MSHTHYSSHKKKDRKYSRNRSKSSSTERKRSYYEKKSRPKSKSPQKIETFNRKNESLQKDPIPHQEIFELLGQFKTELIIYLESISDRKRKIRWNEIFTRWYMNSLDAGHNDYFMPKNFIINDKDILYFENFISTKVKFVVYEIEKIWEKYKNVPYKLEATLKKHMIITNFHEQRLKELYKGPDEDYQKNKNLLITVYYFLDFYSGSIPPKIFEGSLTPIFELFGSPFNTTYDYCSAFYFEKVFFSSYGSFFDFEPMPNRVYTAHPTNNDTFMNRSSDKILEMLEKCKNIYILVLLPVYDPQTQKKYNLKKISKEPFRAYDKLVESKYFCQDEFIDTEKYNLWNYNEEKYYSIPLCDHFILLKNTEEKLINFDDVLKKWRDISEPQKYKVTLKDD